MRFGYADKISETKRMYRCWCTVKRDNSKGKDNKHTEKIKKEKTTNNTLYEKKKQKDINGGHLQWAR